MRPERAILTKYPSSDRRPISAQAVEVGLSIVEEPLPLVAFDAVIEVAVRVGAVEQAAGDVVDAHVQPGALAPGAEASARERDGVVGDLPVDVQTGRIDGHRRDAVVTVAPGNVLRHRYDFLPRSEVELGRKRSAVATAVGRRRDARGLQHRLVADRRHAGQPGERHLDAAGQVLARQLGHALQPQARRAIEQLLLRRLREKIHRRVRGSAVFTAYQGEDFGHKICLRQGRIRACRPIPHTRYSRVWLTAGKNAVNVRVSGIA